MKIWHVGASSSPYRVDGVSRTVWLLSRYQARLGHDVSLVIDTPPDPAAIEIARDAGMHLIHVESTYLGYPNDIRKLVGEHRPDIVHMHSVFVVRQATMARVLGEFGIPYVITPHGGLAPQVLRRGVLKKSVYAALRERPRFMGAAAVLLVTPAEERAVRSFLPDYHRPIRWMPNPVDVENLDPHRWQGLRDPRRIAFLGRFDVLVKGIDILIEIARLLPDIKVDLYGTEDPKTKPWLDELKKNLPSNLSFHDPIFGVEKSEMLSRASLYIQPSRWEGFPVSVAECLYLGVPSAVADTLDMAQLFFQKSMGLVIPLDPMRAALQLRAAMADGNQLQEWSQRGREFALQHFHPLAAAQRSVALYQDVLKHRPRHTGHRLGEGDIPAGEIAQDPANGWQLMPASLRGNMKSNVSRLFERSSRAFGANGVPRVVVLCYHSVNNTPVDLSIDPRVFRGQMLWLKEMGFTFMNFGDLTFKLLRWGLPRTNIACITFDDGYEDNLTQAAPILAELGVPATTFVTTGLMNREAAVIEQFREITQYETNYLSRQQVVELANSGMEIGAHTHTHANLARLSRQEAREQVVISRERLEDVLGHGVRSFAYPFGKRNIHYTSATVQVVRESGFTGAAAVAFRAVTARESIHIFEIPRFFVNRSDTSETFEQKVKGHFDWLGSIQERTPKWLKTMVSPEDAYTDE